MNHDERTAACSANKVERTADGYRLWTWHPQWGGYGGHACVDFHGDDAGCFEFAIYHDGEFPSDKVEHEFHCCDALQFVRFGLDVYEAQAGVRYHTEHGASEQLFDLAERVRALAEKVKLVEKP